MRGTCPMAKIGQHFVGMLWTQKEHISGARRYVQHARPGGHIEERPLAVAQAEPTSGVARKPGTPPARARLEIRLARQIDDSRFLYPQRGPRYAASVDVAPKIETRVGENEARSLRAVRGQAEESHDADKQQENGEQEIQRPHAGRYDLVHRLHDAYLLCRPVDPPHSPQHVRDLSHGRPRPHRIENRLHERCRGIAPRRLRRARASAEYSGAGTEGTSCSSAYSFTPTTRLSPDAIARWASYALRAIAS